MSGIEHVLHQALDDAGEGGADDDADGEVDDVAAHDEVLEIGDPAGPAEGNGLEQGMAPDLG